MTAVDWVEEGLKLPPGYRRWYCDVCTASCNFEAMNWCAGTPDCGFDLDKPESLDGAFEFIVKDEMNKED